MTNIGTLRKPTIEELNRRMDRQIADAKRAERVRQQRALEQATIKATLQAMYDAVVAERDELEQRLKLHRQTIRKLVRENEALRVQLGAQGCHEVVGQ